MGWGANWVVLLQQLVDDVDQVLVYIQISEWCGISCQCVREGVGGCAYMFGCMTRGGGCISWLMPSVENPYACK